jgi:hypothetical protein
MGMMTTLDCVELWAAMQRRRQAHIKISEVFTIGGAF